MFISVNVRSWSANNSVSDISATTLLTTNHWRSKKCNKLNCFAHWTIDFHPIFYIKLRLSSRLLSLEVQQWWLDTFCPRRMSLCWKPTRRAAAQQTPKPAATMLCTWELLGGDPRYFNTSVPSSLHDQIFSRTMYFFNFFSIVDHV